MKGIFKYLSHEAEYVVITTVALVVLGVLVFPLFIGLLPVILIVGCASIWNFDHIKDKPKV
jgi:hypothetical protein